MSDDPFRFCIYCGADCYENDPEHAADCPQTTDVYPVTDADLREHYECPHCCCPGGGMRCGSCQAEFQVGEHYTHRWEDEGDVRIGLVLCLGCAAREALVDS